MKILLFAIARNAFSIRVKKIASNALLHLLWLGYGIIILSGCASAPVQEMSDARQAIEAARSAGADQRSPKALNDAENLLLKAERRLEEGDFKEARNNAAAAKDAAIKARTDAIKYNDKE